MGVPPGSTLGGALRNELFDLSLSADLQLSRKERLVVTGSMAAFDAAIVRKDRVKLREILGRLFLTGEDVDRIIDQVLSTR